MLNLQEDIQIIPIEFHLYADREWLPGFLLGFGLDFTDDSYSQNDLESDARNRNIISGYTLPDGSRHLGTYLNTQLGQLNYDNYLVEGAILNFKTTYRFGLNSFSKDILQSEIILKYFYLLPYRFGNVGTQITLAESTSNDPHFQYYVGGLDAVRGYHHGQFITPAYWKLNLEYRVESIRGEWFVLQHIFFTDIGNIGNTVLSSIGSKDQPFIGYGTGIRLISPRVYRLNVRVDYGFTFGREGPGGFSFGFQQFF